jgi:hypothetical protein
MPRITPGITSGASIIKYSACLGAKERYTTSLASYMFHKYQDHIDAVLLKTETEPSAAAGAGSGSDSDN